MTEQQAEALGKGDRLVLREPGQRDVFATVEDRLGHSVQVRFDLTGRRQWRGLDDFARYERIDA